MWINSEQYINNKIRNAAKLTVTRIKDKTYKKSVHQNSFVDYNDILEEDTNNFIAFLNSSKEENNGS